MKRKVLLGCYAVLMIIGIAVTLYKLFTVKTSMQVLVAVATLIMYLSTAIYVAVGYKKPHGNGLRYTMLAFAFSLIFDLNFCVYLEATHFFNVAVIVMLLIAYMSGRLQKIQKNKILCIVILAGMIYMWLNTSKFSHNLINTSLSQLILWINLCLVYVARYVEHREAGLEDAKDEKSQC